MVLEAVVTVEPGSRGYVQNDIGYSKWPVSSLLHSVLPRTLSQCGSKLAELLFVVQGQFLLITGIII